MGVIAADFVKRHEDTGDDDEDAEDEERDGESDFFDGRAVVNGVREIVHH